LVQFVIEIDGRLERARAFLGTIPKAAEQATARALNKAAAEAREAAVSAIVERYAVHAADVRGKITLATASPNALGAAIVARSGSLSLGYFPHSPVVTGTGGPGQPVLHAEVLRGQDRSVGGAFIATINGKPRVMIRTGGNTKTGRTQIKSVYTVPLASMLGAASVQDAVEDRVEQALDKHLELEIDRALGKVA
jgi:minor tail protein Z (GPZ)